MVIEGAVLTVSTSSHGGGSTCSNALLSYNFMSCYVWEFLFVFLSMFTFVTVSAVNAFHCKYISLTSGLTATSKYSNYTNNHQCFCVLCFLLVLLCSCLQCNGATVVCTITPQRDDPWWGSSSFLSSFLQGFLCGGCILSPCLMTCRPVSERNLGFRPPEGWVVINNLWRGQ